MSKSQCDWCNGKLPKGRRRFCKDRCKDSFHNHHNPRGKFAHLNTNSPNYVEPPIDEGPEGWDGHKDTFR